MNKSLIAVSIAVLAGSALAQTNSAQTPRLDKRQANQEQRIQQGVASGSLTATEANRLEKGQEHLQTAESRAKADGKVTKKERAHLTHAANKQSRHIAGEKHDAQRN